MKKKLLALLLTAVMVFGFAVPALADGSQTIYLKGTGSNFTETWQNVFYLGGAEDAADPQIWHLVYTGNNVDAITAMQLDFGDNGIWEWDPEDGFSVNNGGNNPGWVVVAPFDWELEYVNSGNNNESESFVVTDESGNINFNISGYHKGSEPPRDPEGGLAIEKTVRGYEFFTWAAGAGFTDEEIDEILEGLTFTLYRANADGTAIVGGPIKTVTGLEGKLASYALIDFGNLDLEVPAWYAVVEELDGKAAEVFKDVGTKFFFIGEMTDGSYTVGSEITFDFEANYLLIANDENADGNWGNQFNLGAGSVVNAGGEIFKISVKNDDPASDLYGKIYGSFCALNGATAFGGAASYLRAEPKSGYKELVDALNYIYNTYGSVDAYNYGDWGNVAGNTRILSQILVWNLYCNVNKSALIDNNLVNYPALKAAIDDVFENYDGTVGPITHLAYLTYAGADPYSAQPQLVPVFGGDSFDNDPDDGRDPKGFIGVGVTIDAYEAFIDQYHKYGTYKGQSGSVVSIIDMGTAVDKKGNVTPVDAQKAWGAKGYAWNNQHTAVTLDVAALKEGKTLEFEMCIANKAQTPVGLSYFVELVGNELVITFGDNLVRGTFGADVYTTNPEKSNNPPSPKDSVYGNGDSFSATLPNSKTVFTFANQKELWLYFKADNGSNITLYTLSDPGDPSSRVCVFDRYSDVYYNDAELPDDLVITAEIIDAGGILVDTLTADYLMGSYVFDGASIELDPGFYTVVLKINGVEYDRAENVEVEDKDTTMIDFDIDMYVVNAGNPTEGDIFCPLDCGIWK